MERLRRVGRLWSWLPAFRVVAETPHLPSASQQLLVSASALSRTIKLLEQDVGQRLFLRNGRRIELNDAGERLLVAVRTAMRTVHDALLALEHADLGGPVYISASGVGTTAALPGTLSRLRRRHPEMIAHIRQLPDAKVNRSLLRGDTDVALVTQPTDDAELTTTQLGTVPTSVYCGRAHPLFTARAVSLDDMAPYPFVAVAGHSPDAWPPATPRTVGVWIDDPSMALQLCMQGEFLTVLPDTVGEAHPHLRRLPIQVTSPLELFAVARPTLGAQGRPEAVIAAAAEFLAESAPPP